MTLGKALGTVALVSTILLSISAWMFGSTTRGPAWLFFTFGAIGWLVFLLVVLMDVGQSIQKKTEEPTIVE